MPKPKKLPEDKPLPWYYLDTYTVVKHCKLGRSTLIKLRDSGEIGAFWWGRKLYYDVREVEAYLRAHKFVPRNRPKKDAAAKAATTKKKAVLKTMQAVKKKAAVKKESSR